MNKNLLIFTFLFLILNSFALAEVFNLTPTIDMALRSIYWDVNTAGSIEGATGMEIDTVRNFSFISGTTDSYITVINFSDPTAVTAWASWNDATPPGSIENPYYTYLDQPNNLLYVCSYTDDTSSIYNVTTTTWVEQNSTAADATGAGSKDGCYANIKVQTASYVFSVTASQIDSYVVSHNVTNLKTVPAVISSYVNITVPGTVAGVKRLAASGTYIIANAPGTNRISILNVSNVGAIANVGSGYTDLDGAGSIQGATDFLYESATGYIYVPGTTDGYLTILGTAIPDGTPDLVGSIGNLITPQSVAIGWFGNDKLAFVGSQTAGAGIAVINISTPASPTLLGTYNDTFGVCAFANVSSLWFDNRTKYLYVTSREGCFYSIAMTATLTPPAGESDLGITDLSSPYYVTSRQICKDGSGVLHATFKENNAIAGYFKSTDSGATWTRPYMISTPIATAQYVPIGCDTNTGGKTVAMFYSNTTSALSTLAASVDSGTTWAQYSYGRYLGTTGINADYPNVEVRGNRTHTFAKSLDADNAGVFLSMWANNGTLIYNFTYLINTTSIDYNRMFMTAYGSGNASDKILVGATETTTSNDARVRISTDSGATWSANMNGTTVSTTNVNACQAAFNNDGTMIHMVCSTTSNDAILYTNSSDGVTWAAYTTVSGTGATRYRPTISMDNNNLPIIFWETNLVIAGGVYNIVYSRFNGTAWSAYANFTTPASTATQTRQPKANAYYVADNQVHVLEQYGDAFPYWMVYKNMTFASSPTLSCSFGTGVSNIQYRVNSAGSFPMTVNATWQTATVPVLNCTNTGGAGTLKMKRNDTYAGVDDICDTDNTPIVNLTTTYQALSLGTLNTGVYTGIWCMRNYSSAIPSGSRKSIGYSVILE